VHELCREAEVARIEHGTSFADLGRALGLGGGQVARICRGRSPRVSLMRLSQLFAVLGLELSARAFPSGPRVRDTPQLRLLGRLRAQLGPGVTMRFEVPVAEIATAGSIDHRAWDAAIDGSGWTARVDAETHVGDLQAVLRRVNLKARDSTADCVVLLLAETRHHRGLLRLIDREVGAQFPVPARRALAALRAGRSPGGNALLLL
jgi:transcriptional regulator with XRE-family HTH domain